MKILVTAGNTQTPIDRVRCITNIFSGRTGTGIAQAAYRRGHDVHLLTSYPDLAASAVVADEAGRWTVSAFRTFDELHELMATRVASGDYQAIVHCAAVSDYQLAGIYAPAAGTEFDNQRFCWLGDSGEARLFDARAGKVKSQHQELWMRLTPTPKLVDKIRMPWGFRGVLVKFKLEVDVSQRDLAVIAAESRRHSDADLIVANTLHGMHDWALLGRPHGEPDFVHRHRLAELLLDEIETIHRDQTSLRSEIGSAKNSVTTLAPVAS